jgi:hypothetical protein
VSEHVEPQSVIVLGQLATHCTLPPDALQRGVAPVQAVPHVPQLLACERLVSHPSVATPLQLPNPGAHDDAANAHMPPLHVVGPLTLGRAVQSFPQAPQLAGCDRSVAQPAPVFAQSAKPGAHSYEQLPDVHTTPVAATFGRAVQSWPHMPQLCTAVGETQSPAPPHVRRSPAHPQAPHWHVGPHICVPPVPQACVASG